MPQKGMPGKGLNEGQFGRPRRLDDVSEIINFVRNYQTVGIHRETTEIRLSKKAPLPSIGHSTEYMIESPRNRHRNQLNGHVTNNNLVNNHVIEEDAAYESDAERELDMDEISGNGMPTPPGGIVRQQTMYGLPQNANRLSRSLDGVPEQRISPQQPSGMQRKYQSEPSRSKPKMVHHLPPMEQDLPERPGAPRPMSGRGERPRSGYGNRPRSGTVRPKSGYGRRREYSRPAAPSPSLTPPLPDSHLTEEDGDPIDFIDCTN